MLFNSIDFAIFLPIIFILYWFVTNKNLKLQNLLIVISSYIFYGWWDWRFLSLILFSTIVDYFIGIKLSKQESQTKRKILLWTSIFVNLGFLGFFKYYNFFLDNFITAFSFFGTEINANSLNIILPVGISFYTFQTLSYTIDVYKRKLEPTKDFIAFSAFVSFFPQLVAGPIERATNLLPQFYTKRYFDYSKAIDGMRLILWGLFKKVVIADTCSIFVDDIFQNYMNYSGGTLIVGAILFSFQIYCDFSGYSDIAIGTAKLFGINLMTNFRTPYFSRNIAEFWRRWHISLSTWFRDYLYIPLGGSKTSKKLTVRNIFIIFIVSGFWHGANWTYIIWGSLNAFYFLPIFLMKKNRKHLNTTTKNKFIPSFKELNSMFFTFIITAFTWIFFRSKTVTDAFEYIKGIFNQNNFFKIQTAKTYEINIRPLIIYLTFFIIVDWYYRNEEIVFTNHNPTKSTIIFKYIIYLFTIISIIFSIKNQASNFIYFQF
ncbi:MBOAT family protein [Flavobacteriaceae bacterium]|nr:MBOAT family protein [Flavobacteriaceae bacterium]